MDKIKIMKFVIAPDKFKNSLTAFEFCDAVSEGILKVIPNADIVKCPLADGGDGTLEVINYYLTADKLSLEVSDPFFQKVKASYLYSPLKKTAYIEMAEASGLKVLGNRSPDCVNATSLGTGELIKDAIERGAKEIILGIGGSACNDACMGIAQALGYEFIDENGDKLSPVGQNLIRVSDIRTENVIKSLSQIRFYVACDVDNPFYGERGAAKVYAPQKGATPKDVSLLDKGMRKFSSLLFEKFNIDVQQVAGSGAAGGVGGGALCFLKGELTSGIDLILRLSDFSNSLVATDFIITGEGVLDRQTMEGKTIKGIVKQAGKSNIPVVAMCGSSLLNETEQEEIGLKSVLCIQKGVTDLETAMREARGNLVFTAFNFAKLVSTK
jgi:glycerate kinase